MADGFRTKILPPSADHIAPDGSEVRILHGLKHGGMAHFELAPGQTSTATKHRTVEEIWFFLSGQGEMWRRDANSETIVEVFPNVSLTIPLGTQFQFRSLSDEPLRAIGQTMPPWPGDGEAIEVEGPWVPTVGCAVR
jgi:mannose-6-phosphate isomerase-like protein (cupin superfamily)